MENETINPNNETAAATIGPSTKRRSGVLLPVMLVALLSILAAGWTYYNATQRVASYDAAHVEAPLIQLAPQHAGTLQEVYVQTGDEVPANTAVARVGNEIIKTTTAVRVVAVNADLGKIFNPGEAVVTVIDPKELRVVVRVDEDKGLKDIKVGQAASFTVDAFGSRKFVGVVDEISPTSRPSDVAFNISDKREVKQFDVKIRYDLSAYPELKNGMSAKVDIYKN